MALHGGEACETQLMLIVADDIWLAIVDVVALLADGANDIDFTAFLHRFLLAFRCLAG